jgi:hypothetical protein
LRRRLRYSGALRRYQRQMRSNSRPRLTGSGSSRESRRVKLNGTLWVGSWRALSLRWPGLSPERRNPPARPMSTISSRSPTRRRFVGEPAARVCPLQPAPGGTSSQAHAGHAFLTRPDLLAMRATRRRCRSLDRDRRRRQRCAGESETRLRSLQPRSALDGAVTGALTQRIRHRARAGHDQ